MLDHQAQDQRRQGDAKLGAGEVKGQLGEACEYPPRSPIPFIGPSDDLASLYRDKGELAGNEEGIDQQEKRDECQTGGGTNEVAPSGSQCPGTLVEGIPVTPAL